MTDLISVIIPVYNGERYLAEAIESVLAQTRSPDEIIIVDDGSTDDSAAVARRYASLARLVQQPNLGAGAARNRGVEAAQGAWLAFLDADDLWLPDKLTRQMALFEADPDLATAYGGVEQFISPDLDEILRARLQIKSQVAEGFHVGTLLIRRATYERVGFFSTAFRVGEFIDWYARAEEMGLKSGMVNKIVLRRRIHANNLMQREQNIGREYARILKKTIERRRTQKE